jgi:hypothetical protein
MRLNLTPVGKIIDGYKSLDGKIGMRPTERPRSRWAYVIKIHAEKQDV